MECEKGSVREGVWSVRERGSMECEREGVWCVRERGGMVCEREREYGV